MKKHYCKRRMNSLCWHHKWKWQLSNSYNRENPTKKNGKTILNAISNPNAALLKDPKLSMKR